VAAAPTPVARLDPSTEVVIHADGPRLDVCVRWNNPRSFKEEVEAHLRFGALNLPGRFLRPEARLEATLITPSGQRVECHGHVALVDEMGTGLALDLAAADRATLRKG